MIINCVGDKIAKMLDRKIQEHNSASGNHSDIIFYAYVIEVVL